MDFQGREARVVSVLPSSHHTLLKTSECCSIGDGVFVWLGGLGRYGTMEQLILTTTSLDIDYFLTMFY